MKLSVTKNVVAFLILSKSNNFRKYTDMKEGTSTGV